MASLMAKFQAYSPSFKGPYKPEESVKLVLSVLGSFSATDTETIARRAMGTWSMNDL